MIDAHLHVDLYPETVREPLLRQAFSEGVRAVIGVSMHQASSKLNRELALRFSGRMLPAYGYHPEQELPTAQQADELIDWIRERHEAQEPFAIGEVGLPYYTRTETETAGKSFDETPYVELLERFIILAAELDRPIVLHAVYEDADKACDLLQKHAVKRAHFHWFKGAASTVERMIEHGYYISVTPDVAYEPEIEALVRAYPLQLMMVETDGPWPFEGPYAGKQTQPGMIRDVCAHIAALKGETVEAASAVLLRNTQAFYGLEQV